MANNVSNVGFSDFTADQQDIDRRKLLAQKLQEQSMAPQETQMAGGWAIPNSWTQGLAKALQGYAGYKGQEDAKAQQKELGQRARDEFGTWAGEMPQAQTRDLNLVHGDDEGNAVPPAMQTAQPTQQQMMAWALKGGASGNPYAAQMAGPFLAQALKMNDPYTLNANAKRMVGNQVIAEGNPQQFRPPEPKVPTPLAPGHTRTVLEGEQKVTQELQPDGTYKEIGRGPAFAKAVAPVINNAAPVTPVTIADPKDPNKTLVIDGRTRQVLGEGPKLTQGGAAQQKLTLGQPQAKLRVESMAQNFDKLDQALGELDADPGLSNITGTIMGRTPNLTNKATGAQAKLNSVKSQIFVSALQAMREASKTGGAVGNVSDREGDKLESTLAALDQAQSTADFRKQLGKARQQLGISKALIQNAYDEQYGGVQAAPAAPGQPRVVDW